MPQLHNVIGAVLRDIAQARVTSDFYSREVSQYYEKDSLLRLFPVPRSEIREVEFELKFSITDVDIDPSRQNERDVKVSDIFTRYSESIGEDIFINLRGSRTIQKIEEWAGLIRKLENDGLLLELKNAILQFFEDKSRDIVTEETTEDAINLELDMDYVRDGIKEIVDRLVYQRADVVEMNEKYKDDNILASVNRSVSRGFHDQLSGMNNDIEILEASQEYKVDVDVTAGKLFELPEAAISSIKVTTDIRNYTWSQVEEKDNKVIRRLVPE